ncbi:MAG: pirin family protein, partial [Ignavibacterium sp.]|nr:pirin family protein [Ignavibacterium sp.]MDW8375270.1 pirin family protein [Ignavibacteriales bacterium]
NLWINQNAFISLSELEESKELIYNLHSEKNGIYLFLISGELLVEEQLLQKRDAIGIWETNSVKISAIKNSYFLVIEVPME